MVSSVVVRSYKLKLYGNIAKTDTARYTIKRFNDYANMFLGKLFFRQYNISTKNMGKLANQSLYKANRIIKAQRQAHKKTGDKMNVPFVKHLGCYAKVEKSKNSKFDYWVSVSNQWLGSPVKLPAQSHKALNKALQQGWQLALSCECKLINGNLYAIVFVSKNAPAIHKPKRIIGCDVGIIHSVVTSEGYKGYGLSRILKVQKRRQAERRRQSHKISNKTKTHIKQILDREARGLIRRSVNTFAGFAIESPKRLANLRSGKLQGWARSYFANRLDILGKENGVKVIEINPYQTSITCSKCGVADKRNRAGRIFNCVKCGYINHADINASKVIALRGRATLISDRKNLYKNKIIQG